MAWRKPANLNEWFGILVRHKKKFFFPAIVVMILVVYVSQWYPREYYAEAKFQRKSNTSMQTQGDSPLGDAYGRMRAMMQYNFKGRPAIEKLIRDLHLQEGLPHNSEGQLTTDGLMVYNDLIARLTGSINVGNQVTSDQIDLMSVSFTDKDRNLVPKVVNTLVENYMREVKAEMDETLLTQKKEFDLEVNRYMTKVRELENSRTRFLLDHGNINPEDPIYLYNKLNELKSKRDKDKAEFEKGKAHLQSLLKWEKEQPEFTVNRTKEDNEDLVGLKANVKKVQEMLDENVYGMRRTKEHPAVKDLLRRLVEAKKAVQEFEGGDKVNEEEVPNKEKIQAQKDIATKGAELMAMEKSLEEQTAEVERFEVLNRNFFQIRTDYLKIARDLTDATDQLKFWLDNLRRTQMALTMTIGERGTRLMFIQRAPDTITKPSSPTLFKILGAAIVLGIASGVLMIVLAELLDHSYRSVEQAIDEIKLPVLGAINEIVSPAAAMRRKILGWGVFPLVTTVLALLLTGVFVLTYLSLEAPHKYDQLKESPGQFIRQYFTGV